MSELNVLNENQMVANFNRYKKIIEDTFEGERQTNLLKLVEHFEDRLVLAPASGKEHFHLAHYGGLCQHLLHVYDISIDMFELWKKHRAVVNYSIEELTLVALFHDLGKIGDLDEEYYVPQDSDWHRANRGEIFKLNEKLVNMPVPDRSLFLLQYFDVKLTPTEWYSIKIHDGLYDEGNKSYLIVWSDERKLKNHLPYLIHHADMMATQIEYEWWKQGTLKENSIDNENLEEDTETKSDSKTSNVKRAKTMKDTFKEGESKSNFSKNFDDLFKIKE